MRKSEKWMRLLLVCVMLLGLLMPQKAYAIERLDSEKNVTLKIDYQNDEKPIEGAEFKVYKVANVSGFGEFELTEEFEAYPVVVTELDTEGWRILAETLATYVAKDKIKPTDFGKTDESGVLQFPASQAEMSTGLYLVLGDSYTYNYQIYTPEPTLICLPNRNLNDAWIYDVSMKPKYEVSVEMTDLQVVKIWKDCDNEKVRPAEIEVELLMDGEVIDTVKLSKENNWRFEWGNLAAGHDWKVIEKKVPEGYTVAISKNQTTYVVTNTYTTPENEVPPPELPQTGMLWWPVPILAGAGLLCFMIGWIRRQRSGE